MQDYSNGELPEPIKTISYRRVVSLSHEINPKMPRWPGDPPVKFDEWAGLDREGYRLRRITLGEHSGTHMNAPGSFHRSGAGVDSYPAESLVLPAVVMDLPGRAAPDADYTLAREDVLEWERQFGVVAPGSLLLLRTNWSRLWDTPDAYLGLDESGIHHYPGFGPEAADFLLRQRAISGLGIDTPGVDPGVDAEFTINRMALEQPRIVLENLTNLDRLPPTGATVVIGPLRLQGGSGSPVSVLAFVP